MKTKTWTEKYLTKKEPVVKKNDYDFADIPAGAKMLIATPAIVDAYIRKIPKGKRGTLQQMRRDLAAIYGADFTCPVTAGIFLRIVAEKAYEDFEKGKAVSRITPFWRIIDLKSSAANKLSFGKTFLKKMIAAEHGKPVKHVLVK